MIFNFEIFEQFFKSCVERYIFMFILFTLDILDLIMQKNYIYVEYYYMIWI